MARVSSYFSSETFNTKLANGIVMVHIGKASAPWTGTIVGANSGQTLIFTAGHCIDIPQLSPKEVAAKLHVKFNGDPTPYPADICVYLEKTEILILRVNRYTDPAYKFEFAPKTQHALKRFQPIVTYAHPHSCVYQSADGTICSEEFKNARLGYDPNMIFFNHRMDLPNGCSGASIFNESGNIIGLQSGMYVDTFNVMDARPFNTLAKQSEMQPGRVSLADEIRNLNDEMGKPTVSFSQGSCMRRDTVPLEIPSSGMKYAVHIKYIDRILRTRVFNGSLGPLDKLLEDGFIVDSSLAASSSSRSRK